MKNKKTPSKKINQAQKGFWFTKFLSTQKGVLQGLFKKKQKPKPIIEEINESNWWEWT